MASSDVPTLADLPGARCSAWNRGKNVVRPPRHANSYPHVVAARAVTPFVPLTLPSRPTALAPARCGGMQWARRWSWPARRARASSGPTAAACSRRRRSPTSGAPMGRWCCAPRAGSAPCRARSACCWSAGRRRRRTGCSWPSARPSGGWRHLTYEAAARAANAIGQALLDRGLGPDRPLHDPGRERHRPRRS